MDTRKHGQGVCVCKGRHFDCHRTSLNRSAMRVCQPGPVAFHRSIKSAGNLIERSFRGLLERGRPPLFTVARASMSSVASGNSSYSTFPITCASTRARSDFKERSDAGLFTFIGFPHAEYVTFRATRCVSDYDHPTDQHAITNDSNFSVVLSRVFHFDRNALEHQSGVCKVQPSFRQSSIALDWIEGNSHRLLYLQKPGLTSELP